MQPRSGIVRRQRRAFAIGLGLSVAIHVAALALLRIGVPAVPRDERAARSEAPEDRYLRQRPLRVVRLETAPLAATEPNPATAALPERSATAVPAEADAVAAPKLTLSSGALDLRPVEATSGGLEAVAFASTAASAAGSGAALDEGVVYEAASRAAREAARERGRDRRGAGGSGIGIRILGPGSGDCGPSLLPGGEGRIPAGIMDDFAGRFGGSGAGGRGIGANRPGGRAGGLLGGGARRPGGGLRVGGSGRRP